MENNVIGRVLATEKRPTTIDDFTFWTDPQLILNPFDIVKVQHVNNSYSYGVIEDIAHITDAASFLTVSAKYCYATHELRLHQNDRCKRFTLV